MHALSCSALNESLSFCQINNLIGGTTGISSYTGEKTSKGVIGHYTAMVWAETYKIGCAIATNKGKWNTVSSNFSISFRKMEFSAFGSQKHHEDCSI